MRAFVSHACSYHQVQKHSPDALRLELQMAVSHHGSALNQAQVLSLQGQPGALSLHAISPAEAVFSKES